MNKRQGEILHALIDAYLAQGEAISSGFLVHHYGHWRLSPATIRNEFSELTQEGFLEQPHTSAGRIPTAKGYRFFVDNFLDQPDVNDEERERLARVHDLIQLCNVIARESRSVVVSSYDMAQVFETGFSHLLEEPEFHNHEFLVEFIKQAERLRQEVGEFSEMVDEEPQLFIGEEGKNILGDSRFSVLITPIKNKGVAVFLGSTRMNYSKSLALANFLSKQYDD